MFSLLCEAKFWTLKTDIQIRDTDFGAFRYHDKKELTDCPYQEGKKSYSDSRGNPYVLKNKRPLKLKDSLKELEHQLTNHKVVFHNWKDDNILQLILTTGVVVSIGVSIHNGNILKITFDKFLVGKLISENITDVLSTRTHLIFAYNENQITIVNYTKPSTKFNTPEKLTKLEPRIQQVELVGPAGRRLDRKLSNNVSGDMILTWWHSSSNEVYPWSPLVKDKDRANVHIYSIAGNKIELLCYYRTEFDQICVSFSQIKSNFIWLIEQKVSKKGDVTVEYSSHEVVKNALHKVSITSIPLQTQVCCHSLSPDEEKLILGCIDGSIVLFDESRGITRLVKAAFIPNVVSWHNDGALIFIANERSQIQCFDIALSCVRAQLLSEDVTPANLIDLASYFKSQPTLLSMKWNKKMSASFYVEKYAPNDSFLLLVFEGGPIGVLSLIGGGGLINNTYCGGLTPDTIVKQYLSWNQIDKAINLLLGLNWNTSGTVCLGALYSITNYIFRHPFTPERELQLETSLGSFHVPLRPLTRAAELNFGEQIHDLTRRFFHQLLRHQLYEKAYRLAIDLNDADLFVDLYQCAKLINDDEMAHAARLKVSEINSYSSGTSSCSDSFHSSCSCSDSSSDLSSSEDENLNLPPLPQVTMKKSKHSKIPPLPDLSRHSKLRESAFFNRNSGYLHSDSINTIPEERSSDISTSFESETASTSFNDFASSFSNSEPLSPDFGLPCTQILTPEYPHQYETRTSFSENFTNHPVYEPSHVMSQSPRKFPELNLDLDNVTSPPQNTLNVIEKLYDLPTEISRSRQQHGFSKDTPYNRSTSFDNLDNVYFSKSFQNVAPLKLKSPPESKLSGLNPPLDASKSYSMSKLGSFDNFMNIKSRTKFSPPNGNKVMPPKLNLDSPGVYHISKNYPKLPVCLSPTSKLNAYGRHQLPQPSSSTYNPPNTSKQALKTGNPSPTKQKVKFSDTVTQIMVPDISKLSLEGEGSSTLHKLRRNRNLKGLNPAQELADSLPLCLGNENYLKDFAKPQENHDEEESNGTIKVIHFGVV